MYKITQSNQIVPVNMTDYNELVKLLSTGINPLARYQQNYTILHYLIYYPDLLQVAIKIPNIEIDAIDSNGLTPLAHALRAHNNNYASITILLINGANPNVANLNDIQSIDVMMLLIKYGVDINIKLNNSTPLFNAVMSNNYELVFTLLENGADPLIRCIDNMTAYELAQYYNYNNIANLIFLYIC